MNWKTVLPILAPVLLWAACGGTGEPWSSNLPGLMDSQCSDCYLERDSLFDSYTYDTGEGDYKDLIPGDPSPDVAPEPALAMELTVRSVTPAQGDHLGGETVTLEGDGFATGYLQVTFGGVEALAMVVITPHFLNVMVPPHPPGPVDIVVERLDGQQAILSQAFTYTAGLELTGIEPARGPSSGGLGFVVSGQGFEPGVLVLVGGRPVLDLEVQASDRITGRIPPGNPGFQDVTVLRDDLSVNLDNAFEYLGGPVVLELEPRVGPVSGDTLVTLSGTGFTPGDRVRFGGTDATRTTYISPFTLQAVTPAHAAGPVRVDVVGTYGGLQLPHGFFYSDPALQFLQPTILGLVPNQGPAAGGNLVDVVARGLGDISALKVLFADREAQIVQVDQDLGMIRVLVPAGDPGPVPLTLISGTGSDSRPAAYNYLGGLGIQQVVPATGPVEGGQEVLLMGQGFSQGMEVFFGPDRAVVLEVTDQHQALATTPPGSPGPVDVRVLSSGETALLPRGYEYQPEEPLLYRISPPRGSIAGGGVIEIFGAGIPFDAEFRIGEVPLLNPHRVSGNLVLARIPPGEVGLFDFTMDAQGFSRSLLQAFTYFDPKKKAGGTWGGPIDNTLNVTVLDTTTGAGLDAAMVVLEAEGEEPRIGYTNESGQVTISEFGLSGRKRVTAAKPAYTMYSILYFDATNVTMSLTPSVVPQGGSGTGTPYVPPKTWIAGRVFGQDKYIVVPPGDCRNKAVTDAAQCRPCGDEASCQALDPTATCLEIGETGSYCALPCLSNADCSEGYVCEVLDRDPRCIPEPGEKTVWCYASKTSLFGNMPEPGPGFETNEHDIYFIEGRLGKQAVVCYGGYRDADNGLFHPLVMGLRRNVIVLADQVLQDVNITLDIPLTREAWVGFVDLPYYPSGIRRPYLLASLAIGEDGYLSPPSTPLWDEETRSFHLEALPEDLTGSLYGATWSFYVTASVDTPRGVPYAAIQAQGVEAPLIGDGMILDDGTNTFRHQGPPGLRILAMLDHSGTIYASTDQGLYRKIGETWAYVTRPWKSRSIHRLIHDDHGRVVACGSRGTVWRRDEGIWTGMASGLWQDLRDIDVQGERMVAVGPLGSILISEDDLATLHAENIPGLVNLNGVWIGPGGVGIAVGDGGMVYTRTETGWSSSVIPEASHLYDIDGESNGRAWAVGRLGRIFLYDEGEWVPVESGTWKDLLRVRSLGGGRALVTGDDGTVLLIQSYNQVSQVEFQVEITDDLRDGIFDDQGRLWTAGVSAHNLGPFHPFAFFSTPVEGQTYDFARIAWEYLDDVMAPTFHNITFSTQEGYTFWQMMAAGDTTTITLPDLTEILGLDLIPVGDKRMSFTGCNSPEFDINNYRNSDVSINGRLSWVVDLINFN